MHFQNTLFPSETKSAFYLHKSSLLLQFVSGIFPQYFKNDRISGLFTWSSYSSFDFVRFFTARIRRMVEGTVFSLFVSSHLDGGVPGLRFSGVGGPRSQIFRGGPRSQIFGGGGSQVSDFQGGYLVSHFLGGSQVSDFRGGT